MVILGLRGISNGRADHVKDAIEQELQNKDIPLKKVMAFGFDGAATFTGKLINLHNSSKDIVICVIEFIRRWHFMNDNHKMNVDLKSRFLFLHFFF